MPPWSDLLPVLTAKDVFMLAVSLGALALGLYMFYFGAREWKWGPVRSTGSSAVAVLSVSAFFLAFAAGGVWMALSVDDPMHYNDRGLFIRGTHDFTTMAFGWASAVFAFSMSFAILSQLVNRWVYGTMERAPRSRSSELAPATLTKAQKRARLDELDSDSLWARGPEAVAEHMIACWRDIGLVDEWDSDGVLWEHVDSQLHARFGTDEERLQVYETIQARYHALLPEAMR